MKRFLLITLIVLAVGLLSSCSYWRTRATYNSTTQQFMTSLMHKEYDKCISLMELKNNGSRRSYTDSLKSNFNEFREQLVKDFGEDADFTYLRSQKTSSASLTAIPNTITIWTQVSNKEKLGLIETLYDTNSIKIISFRSMDMKLPVPDTSKFWLFTTLFLCVPLFNIYMLIRVKRSDMQYKWLRYLAILFVNLFGIGYHITQGFFYFLFGAQVFLGFSFKPMGYIGTSIIFAIPVGGLYILWQLKTGHYKKDESIKLKLQSQQIKGKRFKSK